MPSSCQWKQGYAVLGADRETSHQIKQDEQAMGERQCFQPYFKLEGWERGIAVKGSTGNQAQMFLILLLLPPAQGYSKAKATSHFPLDKQVVQQNWEIRKKRVFKAQLSTGRCCYKIPSCYHGGFCFPGADLASSVKGMEILQLQSWYCWR